MVVFLTACGGAEERKEQYLQRGKEYLKQENYDKAKIEFKNVLQIDPKYPQGYYYMGQILEKKHDLRRALGNYLKAEELDSNYLDAKARIAKIYVIVGAKEYLDKAQKEIDDIFKKQPDHAYANYVEANIEIKKGKRDEAIKRLLKVINHDPKLAVAYSSLASVYEAEKQADKAIDILNKGIKANPDTVPLRIQLGNIYVKDKSTREKAEALVKQIISIKPDQFKYRMTLANFYVKTGKPADAEAVLREAISLNEDEAVRYLVLAEMLAKTKGAKVAESELLSDIKKKPDMYELQFALSKLYEKQGLTSKAINVLNEIINQEDVSPNGLKARDKLAEIYLKKNNISKASDYIAEVLKENPSDNDALMLKGKIAFINKDYHTVINSIRTVVKNNPKDAEASLLLARAHEMSHQPDLAKATLLSALEADPLNPKNHINYASYLASKGQIPDAIETLDKAIAYFKDDIDLMKAKLQLLVQQKDDAAISDLLDDMAKAHPTDSEVYMLRGQYELNKKNLDKALGEFENAYKYSQAKYKPLNNIVRILMAQGKQDQAISRLTNLTSNKDTAILAHQLLGQIYISNKDKAKALSEFKSAMKEGTWELPYISAASVYMADNMPQQAIDTLNIALKKAENKFPVQLRIATIYESLKQYDKAREIYNQILADNPGNTIAINNLSSILADHGNEDDLKRASELVKSLENTDNVAFKDTLAWVSLKTGDTDKAVKLLEEVVAKSPTTPVFAYHMGMAYYKAGNTAKAREMLQKSVDGKGDFPGKDKARELLSTI